ncbi:hypothetical protein ACR42D_10085 [Desulfovibrio caledoniensis]
MEIQAVVDTLFELVLVLDLIVSGTDDDKAGAAAALAKRELWSAAVALDDIADSGVEQQFDRNDR